MRIVGILYQMSVVKAACQAALESQARNSVSRIGGQGRELGSRSCIVHLLQGLGMEAAHNAVQTAVFSHSWKDRSLGWKQEMSGSGREATTLATKLRICSLLGFLSDWWKVSEGCGFGIKADGAGYCLLLGKFGLIEMTRFSIGKCLLRRRQGGINGCGEFSRLGSDYTH